MTRWLTIEKAADSTGLPASYFRSRHTSGTWGNDVFKDQPGKSPLIDLDGFYSLVDKTPSSRRSKAEPPATDLPPGPPTHLYRHFDEHGVLLYVGISLRAMTRMAEHKREAAWFDKVAKVALVKYHTRREAEEAERLAIAHEKPLHNIQHMWRPPT